MTMDFLGRFGWLATLIAGIAGYLAVLWVMVSTQNLNMFPTLVLIGAATVPTAVLLFAARGTVDGHTPSGLIGLTALVGGLIGTTSAAWLEYRTLTAMPWLGMVAVGFIEEAAKLIVPVLILLVAARRTQGLGLVVGVASGAGFAVLETMGYGLTALIQSNGNVAAVDATLLLRGLLSPAGHVAWTGMTCAALWGLAARPRARHAVRTFVLTYLFAVALHSAWDGLQSLVAHAVVAIVSLTILLVLIHRGHVRHQPQPRDRAYAPAG